MADEASFSRKGFFGEIFSFLKKGVSHQLDQKLSRLIEAPIRPPGAIDEVSFLTTCTRCQECVQVCPYHAIQRMPVDAGVAAKTPFIDPATESCHLCPDTPCITACPTGALKPIEVRDIRMGRAVVNPEYCMTYRDRVCTLCYDACPLPETALQIDGDFHPVVQSGCTGCGMCQKRCPEVPSAIRVLSPFQYDRQRREEETYFGVIPIEAKENEENLVEPDPAEPS